eukprot:7380610-Prymnesium_polylepis.1
MRRASASRARRTPSLCRLAPFPGWMSCSRGGSRSAVLTARARAAISRSGTSARRSRRPRSTRGWRSAWLSSPPRRRRARSGQATAYVSARPRAPLLAVWAFIRSATLAGGRSRRRRSSTTSTPRARIRPPASASLVGFAECVGGGNHVPLEYGCVAKRRGIHTSSHHQVRLAFVACAHVVGNCTLTHLD